jgi:hypothetical protein
MSNDRATAGNDSARSVPFKSLAMTFFDTLRTYPYTATFYIREDALHEAEEFVHRVRDLSTCVMSKYRLGNEDFLIPDYERELEDIPPYVMGTRKWVIKYRVAPNTIRSHTIPGRNFDYTLGASLGKSPDKRNHMPDPAHPLWQSFVEIFRRICVSSEGKPVLNVELLDFRNDPYPPKSVLSAAEAEDADLITQDSSPKNTDATSV